MYVGLYKHGGFILMYIYTYIVYMYAYVCLLKKNDLIIYVDASANGSFNRPEKHPPTHFYIVYIYIYIFIHMYTYI